MAPLCEKVRVTVKLEEFVKFGCCQCGSREFSRPIGTDNLVCASCEREWTSEEYGEMDSLDWEKLRGNYSGDEFKDVREVHYQNDAQFVTEFIENTVDP